MSLRGLKSLAGSLCLTQVTPPSWLLYMFFLSSDTTIVYAEIRRGRAERREEQLTWGCAFCRHRESCHRTYRLQASLSNLKRQRIDRVFDGMLLLFKSVQAGCLHRPECNCRTKQNSSKASWQCPPTYSPLPHGCSRRAVWRQNQDLLNTRDTHTVKLGGSNSIYTPTFLSTHWAWMFSAVSENSGC